MDNWQGLLALQLVGSPAGSPAGRHSAAAAASDEAAHCFLRPLGGATLCHAFDMDNWQSMLAL
eukprot:12926833-Prorocentrum_lima.AAC.1